MADDDEHWRSATGWFRWSPVRRWLNARRLAEEPSLVIRIRALRASVARIPDEDKSEVAKLLDLADMAIENAGRIPTAYDAAWRALHEIRHILCERGDLGTKLRITGELRADLKYHPNREALGKELDDIARQLREGTNDLSIRRKLLYVSTTVGEERESSWRQANRVMHRRRVAAKRLFALGILLVVLLPLALPDSSARSDWWNAWPSGAFHFLMVATCGAIGGLLSGLLNKDKSNAPSIEHHLEQFTFRLRPRIGFVAAILVDLIVRTGFINVDGGGMKLTPELLLLAIAAGFSERILIGHIERIAGRAAPPSTNPANPNPANTNPTANPGEHGNE